jgi:hypothetical protein
VKSKRYKIVISHGSGDSYLATLLEERIQKCGAATFLDVTDIKKGDNFKAMIHEEIRSCQELIAILTPQSARRFWVWTEIGMAYSCKKRIIAVLSSISITELKEIGGSSILEDINVLDLNNFGQYLKELKDRIAVFET